MRSFFFLLLFLSCSAFGQDPVPATLDDVVSALGAVAASSAEVHAWIERLFGLVAGVFVCGIHLRFDRA